MTLFSLALELNEVLEDSSFAGLHDLLAKEYRAEVIRFRLDAGTLRKAAPLDLGELADEAGVYARSRAGRLVVDITADQRAAVQRIIARAINEGMSDDEIAQRIKNVVGLGPRYADAVENMRQGLLKRGISPGIARNRAQDYARDLRLSRALTIARTEIATMQAEVARQMWQEAASNGDLRPGITRRWVTHPDERRCPLCGPMHGKRVALQGGQYNVPGLGMFDGPPAHVNCRCYEKVDGAWRDKEGRAIRKSEPRDADGDGFIDDNKPTRRPAPKRLPKTKRHGGNKVSRPDDKRKLQGQTPTYLHDSSGKSLGKTGSGDTFEVLFDKTGADMVAKFLNVHGHEQQAGQRGQRNIPLDHIIGTGKGKKDRRYAVEVKSTSSQASGGKPKVGIRQDSHANKMNAIAQWKAETGQGMIPLLVGQKVFQNEDGSGYVEIWIHEGDYKSSYLHKMEYVGRFHFNRGELDEAQAQGKINAAKKKAEMAKASKEPPIVDYDDAGDPIYEGDIIMEMGSEPVVYVAGTVDPTKPVKKSQPEATALFVKTPLRQTKKRLWRRKKNPHARSKRQGIGNGNDAGV